MCVKALLLFASSLVAVGCGASEEDPSDAPASGASGASGNAGAAGKASPAPTAGTAGQPRETGGSTSTSGGAGADDVSSGSAGDAAAGSGGAAGGGTGGSAGEPPVVPPREGSLFPLKTGNTWSFRTTKGTEVGNKTQTVGDLEPVGGTGPLSATMAYKMLTAKDDGMDKTESWQAEVDGKIVRYRELAYASGGGSVDLEEHWEPYKLRVDGNQLTVDSTYTEQYRETKLLAGAAPATTDSSDTWKVVAVDEMVTVPAGTFTAVVIEKVGGTSTKRYWFARGVGKVKEQSGAQLEELTSFTLAP
ncbi:MAG: hypothetical protein ABW321_04925 [Polyangiales bacterium]